MSGKIEISRELAERMAKAARSIGLSIADEIYQAIDAAPVVERQEPAQWQRKSRMHEETWYPLHADEVSEAKRQGWEIRALYTSPPAPVAGASGNFSDTQIKALNQFIFEEMGHPSDWCFSDEELKKCLDKVKELNQ